MAEINIAKTTYDVKIVLETGEVLKLTNLVSSLNWSDQKGSLAQRATIALANRKMDKGGYLSDIIKLGTLFEIYANDNMVFSGVVWEWTYTSATEKELEVTAYDTLIYATQSQINLYFGDDNDTQTIVAGICEKGGLDFTYDWENQTHKKMTFKSDAIADALTKVLDEAEGMCDTKYVMLMKVPENNAPNEHILEIKHRGTNKEVFVFTPLNIMSTRDSLSLSSLVTNVLILGPSEDDQAAPELESIPSDTDYGFTLQQIIVKEKDVDMEETRKEAQKILKEKGKPEETIEVSAPDIPQLRKGDKVKVEAGNLTGYFYIAGVTHNATERTMDMELEREQ